MHVVLAGGGTADTSSPRWRMLTRCAATTQLSRSPRSEPARAGARLVPERGYALELVPAVPLPRRVSVDLLRSPVGSGGGRRHGGGPAAAPSRRRRRLRRLCGAAGVSCRPATTSPDRRPRGERPARTREPDRGPAHPARRGRLASDRAAARPPRRYPAAAGGVDAGPLGSTAGGAFSVRSPPQPADCPRVRREPGRSPDQPGDGRCCGLVVPGRRSGPARGGAWQRPSPLPGPRFPTSRCRTWTGSSVPRSS